jgi:hypothetical protein
MSLNEMENEMRRRGKQALLDAASKQEAEAALKRIASEVFRHHGGTLVSVIWNDEPHRRSALVLPQGHDSSIPIFA